MDNLKTIYEGFKNLVLKDEKVEQFAEVKLRICYECPFRKDLRCGKCGCFIAAKTRSSSKCPEGKW